LTTLAIVFKVWSFCNVIHDENISNRHYFEQNIEQSLQHAEALRQSILKRAFEGRLIEASNIES